MIESSSKLREKIYLHRRGLVCASSSCHEWRWRVTTNRGRAACAAVFRGGPAHSTWPAPRGPARATKQNKISKVSYRQGTKKPRKKRHAGSPKPFLCQCCFAIYLYFFYCAFFGRHRPILPEPTRICTSIKPVKRFWGSTKLKSVQPSLSSKRL